MLFRNLYGWRSEVCVKLSVEEAEEVVDREVLTYKINAIAKCQYPIVGSVYNSFRITEYKAT